MVPRSRRSAVVVAACLLLVGAAGLQLADPFYRPPEPPVVDADDPSAEVAVAALRQPGTRDYTVVVELGNRTRTAAAARSRVENSERQAFTRATAGPSAGTRFFANAHVQWTVRDGATRREFGTWDGVNSPFQAPGAARNAAVTVVSRNGSTLVLRVEDTLAARAVLDGRHVLDNDPGEGERANLTLWVDRTDGTLDRARFVRSYRYEDYENDTTERRYSVTVYRFSAWGATEVHRPPFAGYSVREYLVDLYEGPLYDPTG